MNSVSGDASGGSCPHCQTAIPRRAVLIEYETTTGSTAFAECPDCEEIVHPE